MINFADVTIPAPEAGTSYERTIQALSHSKYVFHVNDSHAFGCAMPESDVDFFVQDEPGLHEWLYATLSERRHDPSADNKLYVRGDDFVDVFLVDSVPQVDIVLVVNADALRAARDILRRYFAVQHLEASPEKRTDMWNAALSLYDAANRELPL